MLGVVESWQAVDTTHLIEWLITRPDSSCVAENFEY